MSFWDEAPTEAPYDPTRPPEEVQEKKRDEKGIYLTKKGTYQVYIRMWGKQHFIGTYTTIDEAYNAKVHFIETGIKLKGATIPRKRRSSKVSLDALIKAANNTEDKGMDFYEELIEAPINFDSNANTDFLTKPFDFQ